MNSPTASFMTLFLVLVVAILTVVLPAKADLLVREFKQPAVADGDAMRVAGEIGEDLGWPGERTFGINDPLGFAQGSKAGAECRRILETNEIVEELEFSGPVQRFETIEKQAPE